MPSQTKPEFLRAAFVSSALSPPIVPFLQAVLLPLPFPPSHFMTSIVMSLEFWTASDWATQSFSLALSDSGTRSNHHPGHRAINHPAGTELHFLNCYQFLQGTKRPLWALSSQNFSSLRSLRFMSDAEKDCGESRQTHTLSVSIIVCLMRL